MVYTDITATIKVVMPAASAAGAAGGTARKAARAKGSSDDGDDSNGNDSARSRHELAEGACEAVAFTPAPPSLAHLGVGASLLPSHRHRHRHKERAMARPLIRATIATMCAV